MEDMLTMPQIADRLGVKQSTVRAYKARKQMPEPTVVVGGKPLWAENAIKNWVEKRDK